MRRQRRRLFEDTKDANPTITIDGFELGTNNNFKITTEWVREMAERFNKKYFQNTINLRNLPIKVLPWKDCLGAWEGEFSYDPVTKNIEEIQDSALRISKLYKRSEFAYSEILLHELIHIYVGTVLRKMEVNAVSGEHEVHGKLFLKKMREVNNRGWNIDITESQELFKNRGELDIEAIEEIRKMDDVKDYSIIIYIPKYYYMDSTATRENVFFQVVKPIEWKDVENDEFVRLLMLSLGGSCKCTISQYIKKEGDFAVDLRMNNLLVKGNRIEVSAFLEKEYSKRNVADGGATLLKYINERTNMLSFNKFLEYIKERELVVDNNVMIEELFKSESLKEAKEPTSEEELIKSLTGKDGFYKVFSAKKEGNLIRVHGLIV